MNSKVLSLFSKVYSVTNTRYVNEFVEVKSGQTPDKSEVETELDKKIYESLLMSSQHFAALQSKYPILGDLTETIFMKVIDSDGLSLTINISDGKCNVQKGWIDKRPSFVLPLSSKNIFNLEKILKDGDISIDDAYRIIRVLFLPFLQGLYNGDYSGLPKDKSYLKLDNLIQVEVLPHNQIEVENFEGPARATIVNVDGQWLIFEGFQGDPDVRYSMNVEQALRFAYLIRVELQNQSNVVSWDKLKKTVEKYDQLKIETLQYERSWH